MPQDEIITVHLRIDTFSGEFFENVDLTLGRTREGGVGWGGRHPPNVFLSLFPRG